MRIAIAGLSMGRNHVESWAQCPGAELCAIADLDEKLTAKLQENYNIPRVCRNYEDLLADGNIDIISNCLPTGMHADSTINMLQAGCHVLCEKPPAGNTADARSMADAARRADRVLGYALQRRFSSNVMLAREAVLNGLLGEVYYARTGWTRRLPVSKFRTGWRLDRTLGGGSLLDLGVHMLDSAWYLLGCPRPVSVAAARSTRMIAWQLRDTEFKPPAEPADDAMAAVVRFEGGKTILLETSFGLWRPTGPNDFCEISGTAGGVQVNPNPVLLVTEEHPEPKELPDTLSEKPRVRMVADFLQAAKKGGNPRASAEHGITLMQIIDALMRSADEEREVDLA